METYTVEQVAELFRQEWLDSFSDSGYVWTRSKRKLDAALSVIDDDMRKAAFDMARAGWPNA